MVAGSTAVRWPVPGESGETGLEEAVFTQQWDDDLRGVGGDLDWKPLAPAAARMLRTLGRRGG